MAINKDKTYLVLNYNPHVVCFTARRESYSMPPASADAPSAIPLTIDEIVSLNTSSRVFKNGLLRFEPEYQEDIYDTLRITNWRDILTNEQIEDIIAHPKVETLEAILKIDDAMYFNRIYGAFVGMRNDGVEISSKVESVIRERYRELRDGIRNTRIVVTPVTAQVDTSAQRINDLEAQLAKMQAMLETALAAQDVPKNDVPEASVEEPKAEQPTEKKAKQTRKPAASKDAK